MIGTYRHRITLQAKTVTRDTYGAEIPVWTALATVWASKEDPSGREFWEAQKTSSEVTTRFRIRFRAGLRPDMRVIWGSNTYDILAVLDPDGRQRKLQLMARVVG